MKGEPMQQILPLASLGRDDRENRSSLRPVRITRLLGDCVKMSGARLLSRYIGVTPHEKKTGSIIRNLFIIL